ncbi:hypothetical protein ACWGII_26145 [Streptomyces sp. NPDC054855]
MLEVELLKGTVSRGWSDERWALSRVELMKPHHSRNWAPRGRTPTVPVRGGSRGRTSLAALACYKLGRSSKLIYRPQVQSRHQGARRGFTWKDYRDLIVRAHIQLDGPIVLIWDN